MSGVSPPAPQPAASARRLAQPRTRPQVALASVCSKPEYSSQSQISHPGFAQCYSPILPPNPKHFCQHNPGAHSPLQQTPVLQVRINAKKGRHTTCNQGSPNQPPPDCPDSPSACSLLKPAAPHHFLSPFNSLPHPTISALPLLPIPITTTTKNHRHNHQQWLAPSKPPASPPVARPRVSSLLPRLPASLRPRPVASRSLTATSPVPSLSVRSVATRSRPSCSSASSPSSVW